MTGFERRQLIEAAYQEVRATACAASQSQPAVQAPKVRHPPPPQPAPSCASPSPRSRLHARFGACARPQGANAVHARLVEIFRDEQQKQHAEQTALQDRVERPALEAVEAQVKGLQEREYRAPTRDVPCADERGACLRCYAQNAQAPLDCADKVAALDRCAQAVSRVHLQTAAASQ